MKSVLRLLQLAALTIAAAFASPAFAVTDIQWWHAMSGELGKQVEKLAADFNASQSDNLNETNKKRNDTHTDTEANITFPYRGPPAKLKGSEIETATITTSRASS